MNKSIIKPGAQPFNRQSVQAFLEIEATLYIYFVHTASGKLGKYKYRAGEVSLVQRLSPSIFPSNIPCRYLTLADNVERELSLHMKSGH